MKIKSIEELFKLAGGAVHIASLLDLNQYTVDRWARTGVPPRYYSKLCEKYDVALEDIHNASQKLRLPLPNKKL